MIVAYLLLFLDKCVQLDASEDDYIDNVQRAMGRVAQQFVLAFLETNGIKARGSGAVLKHMRELHRQGTLNLHINGHQARIRAGLVLDAASSAREVLEPTN
ncbi:TPA: hypothetical protein N0F65_011257 [Lagenidium giganteum]|uniref:Uncharacterized protein n=1 Tax=Lagenidium giganteum TaxID=4803 RepID=A0AAV2YWH9_9STRA|nr:TPA: hypothetical protein N0F65_011257 [Lagenidium giganteum]